MQILSMIFLLGLSLMILRGSIPDVFAIVLGNTLLSTGYIFLYITALLSFLSTAMFLLRAFTASTTEIPISYFQLLVFPYIYLMVIATLLNILFPLQVLHNMQREEKLDLKRGES